jgi:DNA-binding NtrC family response regulator
MNYICMQFPSGFYKANIMLLDILLHRKFMCYADDNNIKVDLRIITSENVNWNKLTQNLTL